MGTRRDRSGSFDIEHTGEPGHFESFAKTNGKRYWLARDLMKALGYETWAPFRKTINKAIGACTTLGIPVTENFIQSTALENGKQVEDFKLSRFACCLTAMNGDVSKRNVAEAQLYFISLAEIMDAVSLSADSVDRILIREDISDREITLSKEATRAGVEFYDRFQNAGYRGMYNQNYADLKRLKGMPDLRRSLLDFMRKDELAGNVFRLAMTEGRIKKDQPRGQTELENLAHDVGRKVRQTMIEETGIRPEDLPIGPDIRTVKKALKSTDRGFSEIDDVAKERLAALRSTTESDEAIRLAASGIVPDCPECLARSTYSHFGSAHCTSGALAAGGAIAHCSCDYCSRMEMGLEEPSF